VKILSQL